MRERRNATGRIKAIVAAVACEYLSLDPFAHGQRRHANERPDLSDAARLTPRGNAPQRHRSRARDRPSIELGFQPSRLSLMDDLVGFVPPLLWGQIHDLSPELLSGYRLSSDHAF